MLQWPAAVSPQVALCVISVATPPGRDRTIGRQRIRAALREALGMLLGRPASSFALYAAPGAALQVAGRAIGLSVSHEDGLSIGAIHLHGLVGIDAMRVPAAVDFYPDWHALTRDYLGPQALAHLEQTAPSARARCFAQAWCAHEARLKCAGSGLTEWHAAPHRALAACDQRHLALPPGLVGSISCSPLARCV